MTLAERWEALSLRERVLVGGVGLLMLAFVGRSAFVAVVAEVPGGSTDEAWVQLKKIDTYNRVYARHDAAAKRREEARRRYQLVQASLIPGTTPTQVGAELQGDLGTMAGEAGLNVLSSQILRVEEVQNFHRIGVRLTRSGNLRGVARLLSSIESDDIDLRVTLLEINRKLGARRRPTPTARPGTTSTSSTIAALTATMEVKTFMQEQL